MKLRTTVILLAALILLTSLDIHAQTVKLYEDMSRAERLVFVGEQARRIAREMSATEYVFTPDFERDIQQIVTKYAQRINNRDGRGKTDLRVVFDRGATQAPVLIAAFRARNVSPLIGLYLPWIESEYVNIQPADPEAAVGIFQFLPATGENYGLSREELLDAGKSADAAARYITDSLNAFAGDPMKEALALLSYTQGVQNTTRDLKILLNDQNRACSICALTADRSKGDETYKPENAFYVPSFFAAAIIGENPAAFGLKTSPLSSR